MIWVVAVVVASLSGAVFARSRGGRGVDMAQYAAVWGIIATLASILLWITIARTLL